MQPKTGRKPGMLHVRSHLEHVARSARNMLERDGKHTNGLQLAPIDRDNLTSIALISEAILRKHKATGTRKDIRLERKP